MQPLYRLALPIVAMITTLTASAQDTIYYTRDWDSTSRTNAGYMTVRTTTAGVTTISNRYLNGTRMHTYTLVNDAWNGPDSVYYPDGKLKMAGTDRNGRFDGDWIAWFPSGKVLAKATFSRGQQIRSTFYHEDGSPDYSNSVFLAESEYPGGDDGWLQYLNSHLRYPNSAVKKEAQGQVLIEFVVTAAGEVKNLRISQSSGNAALDKEALRVVKESGKWTPATELGVHILTYKKQPIVFKLQPQ